MINICYFFKRDLFYLLDYEKDWIYATQALKKPVLRYHALKFISNNSNTFHFFHLRIYYNCRKRHSRRILLNVQCLWKMWYQAIVLCCFKASSTKNYLMVIALHVHQWLKVIYYLKLINICNIMFSEQ